MSPATTSSSTTPATADASGSDRPTLMLLDGHSLAYRAFFALPAENFKTQSGQAPTRSTGSRPCSLNLLRDEQPTHVPPHSTSPVRRPRRGVPGVQGQSQQDPGRVQGAGRDHKDVLAAMGSPVMAIRGIRGRRRHLATITTQATALGYRVLVVTGDRDSLQLAPTTSRCSTPAGCLGSDALHSGGGRGEVRPHPAAVPRLRGAARRPERQPARIPRVGRRTGGQGIREYGSLPREPRQRRRQGARKVGDALRANVNSVLLNRHLTRWCATSRCLHAGHSWRSRRGTASVSTPVRRPRVQGAARRGCSRPSFHRTRGRGRLRGQRTGSRAGRGRGVIAETSSPGAARALRRRHHHSP
ncbi:hypothetical protein GS942_26805 [Rhodococcus hoagii]|nr:hypothetical protein [Prescottella equi]